MGQENSFESSYNDSGAGDFMTIFGYFDESLGKTNLLLSGVRCRILLST